MLVHAFGVILCYCSYQATWACTILRFSLHLVDSIFKIFDSRDKVLEPLKDAMGRYRHKYFTLRTTTTEAWPLSFIWSQIPRCCACVWWVVRYMVPWLHGDALDDGVDRHKGNYVMHKLWPLWVQYAWQPWQISEQHYHKSWHSASRSQQHTDASTMHPGPSMTGSQHDFPEHVCSMGAVLAMLLWNIVKKRRQQENAHLRTRSKDLLQSLLRHFLHDAASIPLRLDVSYMINDTPVQEPHVSLVCTAPLQLQVHIQPELEAKTLLLSLQSYCAGCNSSGGTLADLLVLLAQSRVDWLVAQLLFGIEVAVSSTHEFAQYSGDAFDAPRLPKGARVDAHLPDQVGLEEADGLGGPATLCQAAARFQNFKGKFNAVWEQKAVVPYGVFPFVTLLPRGVGHL